MRRDAALWREVDGETVVLDLSSQSYLGINETGSVLWAAIVGGASASDLVSLLVSRFGVDEGRAAQDVLTFLVTCRTHGLIE